MAHQQWEYCQLVLAKWEKHDKSKGFLKGTEDAWSYSCNIRYLSPTGEEIFLELARLGFAETLPFNPFSRAMGLLGAAGWELASVQHGTLVATSTVTDFHWETLSWGNRVAYFKRPVETGRAVNEPKLVL